MPDLTCKQVLENCKVVNSINAASRFSPSYHHSFSMTQENAIFVEMPLRLDIGSLATAHLVGKTCIDCMQIQENLQVCLWNKISNKPNCGLNNSAKILFLIYFETF